MGCRELSLWRLQGSPWSPRALPGLRRLLCISGEENTISLLMFFT